MDSLYSLAIGVLCGDGWTWRSVAHLTGSRPNDRTRSHTKLPSFHCPRR